MAEEFIEGLITFVSYDTSFNCKIKLMFKNKEYIVEIKHGKFEIQKYLTECWRIRKRITLSRRSINERTKQFNSINKQRYYFTQI